MNNKKFRSYLETGTIIKAYAHRTLKCTEIILHSNVYYSQKLEYLENLIN